MQTKQDLIDAGYTWDASGRITSPGKFEGEPLFAPVFWGIALDGFADGDDGRTYTFRVPKSDPMRAEFPELTEFLGRSRTLRLREDSQGFVHCF